MSTRKYTIIKDSKTQSAIIGNIKRCFSRSPQVQAFLKQRRIEEEWFKKDGTKARRPRVFYHCDACGDKFNSNNVQVDHIEPVIPLNIPSQHMSYDVIVKRLFCEDSNLQILCKNHHKEKSKLENATRKAWLEKEKFIIYETWNRVNGRRYIGVHKCIDFDDGYLGSGTALKSALKKYGRDSFHRVIRYVFDNAEEALQKERELVDEDIVKSGVYYNLAIGGIYSGDNIESSNKKSVVCHQTGDIFDSVGEAAESIGISASSISKALDNSAYPVKNLHFFTHSTYDPNVVVSYPAIGRKIVYLNDRNTYTSIKAAAEALSLNYKSLRNAFVEKTDNDVYSLKDRHFLYDSDFDPAKKYIIKKSYIYCVELDMKFSTCTAAAEFIKHKNPPHGGIAIGRAIRSNKKMYKYTWKMIYEESAI